MPVTLVSLHKQYQEEGLKLDIMQYNHLLCVSCYTDQGYKTRDNIVWEKYAHI